MFVPGEIREASLGDIVELYHTAWYSPGVYLAYRVIRYRAG